MTDSTRIYSTLTLVLIQHRRICDRMKDVWGLCGDELGSCESPHTRLLPFGALKERSPRTSSELISSLHDTSTTSQNSSNCRKVKYEITWQRSWDKKWLTAICYDSCYDHRVREEDTAKYEAAAWTGKLETTSTHELIQSSFHTKLVAHKQTF